jgi:hypothetical protein
MDVPVGRAAGLDVHRAGSVACALVGRRGERPDTEICRFGTMTADLVADLICPGSLEPGGPDAAAKPSRGP